MRPDLADLPSDDLRWNITKESSGALTFYRVALEKEIAKDMWDIALSSVTHKIDDATLSSLSTTLLGWYNERLARQRREAEVLGIWLG